MKIDFAVTGTAVTRLRYLFVIAGFILGLCLWISVDASPVKDRITIAVLSDFPPLYSLDNNDDPDGFAIDVIDAVTSLAGLEYDYIVVRNWGEAMEAVRSGKADLIPGIGISPTRKAEFMFTDVFETIPVSCFVRVDTHDVNSLDDLVGRRVAVIDKSAAQTRLADRPGMRLVAFGSIDEATFALLAGKVDGFVFPEPVMWIKAREIGQDRQIKVVGKPLMELRRGYLLRKSDAELVDRLNVALNTFTASPEFGETYLKWWGKPASYWTSARLIGLSGGTLLVSLLGLLGWHYRLIMSLNSKLKVSMADKVKAQERLKASEQRLNRSQEIASFGSFERDLSKGTGYWSDSLFELLGFPIEDEAPSFERFLSTLHPDDRSVYLDSIKSMTMTNPHSSLEFRFKPGGVGEERYALCSQTHEFAEDGSPCKRIGAIQDITERKSIDAELILAKERAEAASRAKSEFLANMSHELRTPLNGAMGMMQLLVMDELKPAHREYVETAITCCKGLTELLGDILDLSRVEAGQLELAHRAFKLMDIFDSVRETFSKVAEDKGIEFVFNLDPDIPDYLEGDPARLRQVLFNLVGNAIKFTDGGKVSVDATLIGSSKPDRAHMLFSIIDTGIGIPDSMIDRVFGAFSQVDGAYSRRFQGAGLGLHIVKRLVELMGGNIAVESEIGVGTSIHFGAEFDLPANSAMVFGPEVCTVSAKFAPKRVLVAEDDRVNRITICRFVEKLGHKVEHVANGEEALNRLAEDEFDLVLMDVQMPVMNGIEATQCIRRATYLGDRSSVPIVALTAHAMSGDRDRFLEAGMSDYLAKPVDIEELEKVLTRNMSG